MIRRRRTADGARPTVDSLRSQGWLLPPALGEPGRASSTRVGSIDPVEVTPVDDRGLVSIGEGDDGWSLDWWIGADDRWHLPAREAAVRQRLVEGAPVVETAVRIPGGDALQRVFGVRGPAFDGGDQYLVVEVENASAVPFALALVVRPFTTAGVTRIGEITLSPVAGGRGRDRASAVLRDRVPVLLLPRSPSLVATGTAGAGDVLETVTAGAATDVARFTGVHDPTGCATAALLFPVPHRAVVRFVLPLRARPVRPGEATMAYPGTLPGAEQVARGWALQTRSCPSLEVPDTGLSEGVAASRRALLLAIGHENDLAVTAARAEALDGEGLHDEAAAILVGGADRLIGARVSTGDAVSVLAGIVGHWRLTRDDALAEALLPAAVAALRLVERDAGPRRRRPADARDGPAVGARAVDALAGLADLLGAVGQERGAAHVLALLNRVGAGTPIEPPTPWSDLSAQVGAASPTWTWPERDADQRSRFLATVRSLLLIERPGELAVLAFGPGPWHGHGVGLRDTPTRWGRFSFAVRWHGHRPALLWELEAHPARAMPMISAPGLDPAWSTTEPRGEALLAVLAPSPDRDGDPSPAEVSPAGLGRAEAMAPRSILPLDRSAPPGDALLTDDGRRRGDRAAPGPPAEPGGSFT